MEAPHFEGKNVEIFNKKPLPLYETRQTDRRALLGLYFSQILLGLGFILILLNNIGVLSSDSYFGSFNWLTVAVFSIGLAINFISIPYLYFSSFNNFKKEDDFWDKETFWILPLFFFGTFFVYGSQIAFSFAIFLISVSLTMAVHLRFVQLSWNLAIKRLGKDLSNHQQYSTTLKYLTAYYVLVLALLFSYDPLKQMFIWIRLST